MVAVLAKTSSPIGDILGEGDDNEKALFSLVHCTVSCFFALTEIHFFLDARHRAQGDPQKFKQTLTYLHYHFFAWIAGTSLQIPERLLYDQRLEKRPSKEASAGSVPGNGALFCPPGFCNAYAPRDESPVFDVGYLMLRKHFHQMMRLSEEAKSQNPCHTDIHTKWGQEGPVIYEVYGCLSGWWWMPDSFIVYFVPMAENRSSLAIHARRSITFLPDFGANRARIEEWFRWLAKDIETAKGG